MESLKRLARRLEYLEATIPNGCGACDKRSGMIHVGEHTVPATCPGCGQPIKVERFTIRIDRAEPWEDDAA